MQIIPDPLVMALQMIPFLVTLVALYKIILSPMLDYLDDRQKTIEKGTSGVDALNAEIAERTSQYENQLKAARSHGSEIRGAKRAEAKSAYAEKIAAARGEAEGRINQALAEIQGEVDGARGELEVHSKVLAEQISSQVLGRPVA